jgi:hypothetical protein
MWRRVIAERRLGPHQLGGGGQYAQGVFRLVGECAGGSRRSQVEHAVQLAGEVEDE